MPTLEDVSRLAHEMPGSEQRRSGGGLAWFVRRKPFGWESMPWPSEAQHVREIVAREPCLGVVLPSEEDQFALIQTWPNVFVAPTTPWVGTKIIVRLDAVPLDHLAELIAEAWRTQAPKYLRREFDVG